ncbi:hypothetical protein AKJ37_05495 [candidate division MSBL1 archaeon SCGC-AAA259I09]|uniref:Small ribosomal subunit protein eS4 n=2 Tax=candidate division MSBL1 TaxID=215777 RepID=A0A133UQ57_9EURY|nr:hypothetical protein AKJ62_01690 [candidate division MSBL1 archaeon SCGC-AAA259D14]KXA96341.1 hypothetical protein AKJ37_05495 [candidate division MSBL1 archaeon SCGC-AAA259I09]
MAKKGDKKHLKRLNTPKVRKAPKKEKKWATASSPGPHSADASIPLSVAMRESLKIARTTKEAKKILGRGRVKIDGKVRRDPKYPVGFMDLVEIPKAGEIWRVIYDRRGHLQFYEVDEDESQFKLAKVVGKHPYKGGKLQLSLHDGRTIVGNFEDIDVKDTVKVGLPDFEVEDHIPCEEGNPAFVMGGTNVGRKGKIKEIMEIGGSSSNRFVIETDGEEFQSPEHFVFIIGKEKSEISLPEVIG